MKIKRASERDRSAESEKLMWLLYHRDLWLHSAEINHQTIYSMLQSEGLVSNHVPKNCDRYIHRMVRKAEQMWEGNYKNCKEWIEKAQDKYAGGVSMKTIVLDLKIEDVVKLLLTGCLNFDDEDVSIRFVSDETVSHNIYEKLDQLKNHCEEMEYDEEEDYEECTT